jgi:hypothetical protein
MRDGIVVEIERRHPCDTGHNADMLETEEEKDGPKQIEKLSCKEK